MAETKKPCYRCGKRKLLSEFHRAAHMKDGHRNICKECVKNYDAEKYEDNKINGVLYERTKRQYKWQRDNKVRRRQYRRSALFRRYGITEEQYDEMWQEQEGCCAICGRHQDEFNRTINGEEVIQWLAIDHDHESGKVRGLLCKPCNVGIGSLQDDIAILASAIEYLEAHRG